MAISFEAIGQKMVTFAAGTGLAEGKVCKISANGTVGPCSEEGFCGVVSQIRGGAAGVILEGYVELSYAGSTAPSLGYAILTTDKAGEVVPGTSGRTCLIVSVDSTNKKIGLDHVKLEKGMYRESGKTFTQVLESLDPSENYKGTALEGTDAFQRQLKRFDIHAKGAYSDPVEKFFRTMDSSVLFPEYIARAVKQGMEENNVLPKITASTTTIDAMDYRSVYSVPSEQDKMLMQVSEGASIPATQVKTKANLVKLNKRGRMLVASYEAIRFQKLTCFPSRCARSARTSRQCI